MFITSPSNYDRINLVIFGDGVIHMSFLTMKCTHNNIEISPLFYCARFKSWLECQCVKHRIDINEIRKAELTVKVTMTLSRGTGLKWLTTEMAFACSSLIMTSEREYRSELSDTMRMGLGQILIDCQY